MYQRGYRPEERASKRGKNLEGDEAVLYAVGRAAGKWTEDDDLALTEAFHQVCKRVRERMSACWLRAMWSCTWQRDRTLTKQRDQDHCNITKQSTDTKCAHA